MSSWKDIYNQKKNVNANSTSTKSNEYSGGSGDWRTIYNEKKSNDAESLINTTNWLYDKIQEYLLTSGQYKDEGQIGQYNSYVSEFSDNLSRLKNAGYDVSGYDSVVSDLKNAGKDMTSYYSQFKNRGEYDSAVKAQQDYEGMLNYDTKAGQAEADTLEKHLEKAKSLQPAGYSKKEGAYVTSNPDTKQLNNYLKSIGYSSINELEADISQKRAYLNLSKRTQNKAKFDSDAKNDKDFSQYAAQGAAIKNPTVKDATPAVQIFGWNIGGDEVTNKVAYTRDNYDELMLESAKATANGSGYHDDNFNAEWMEMTDDEVSTYNYYLAKYGTEKADNYLDSLMETLRYRQATKAYRNIEGKTAQELAFSIAAGLDQFGSGIESLFNDADYIPASAIQVQSGMIREDLADNGPQIFGSSLGQGVYDLGTTTMNMLPSIAVSAMIGTVSKTAGAAVGSTLMGASAAGNAYAEMLNLGYAEEQARAYGYITGALEGGLQYVLGGIGGLGGKLSGNAIKTAIEGINNGAAKFAIEFGGRMASEGIEESLQEIISPMLQNAIFYTNEKINWEQVAYNGLLGALSAGILDGGPAAINTVRTNQYYKSTYGDTVSGLISRGEIGEEFSKTRQLADEFAKQLESDKELKGSQIRKLVQTNEREVTAKNESNIAEAAKSRLEVLGETTDVEKLSAAIAKQSVGKTLTRSEERIISESKCGQQVVDELNPYNIANELTSSAWTESIELSESISDIAHNSRRTLPTNVSEAAALTESDVTSEDENGTEGTKVLTNKLVESIVSDKAKLSKMGIDYNGKTKSQLRAEVKAKLLEEGYVRSTEATTDAGITSESIADSRQTQDTQIESQQNNTATVSETGKASTEEFKSKDEVLARIQELNREIQRMQAEANRAPVVLKRGESVSLTNRPQADISEQAKPLDEEIARLEQIYRNWDSYRSVQTSAPTAEAVVRPENTSIEQPSQIHDHTETNESTDNADIIRESIADMNLNTATADAIVNGFHAEDGVSIDEYILGVKEAYRYGGIGLSTEYISKEGFAAKLTEAQMKLAYGPGKTDANYAAVKSQEAIDAQVAKAKGKSLPKKEGKIVYHLDREVNENELKPIQKASIKFAETLASIVGNNINIYESTVNAKGKRVFSADIAGKLAGAKAPNGFFDTKTGEIYIDINAGNSGTGTILYTLAHEYTHFIRQYSPKKFKALADFLMSEYNKSGVPVKTLIHNQIQKAKKNGRTIDFDTAYEEVVADAMESMLTDTNVAEKIAKLKQTDKTLWEKLKDMIAKLFTQVKKVYRGLNPESIEANYVLEMKDSLEKLSDLFAEGLASAGEAYQAGAEVASTSSITGTEEGAVPQNEFTSQLASQDKMQWSTEEDAYPKFIMSLSGGDPAVLTDEVAKKKGLLTGVGAAPIEGLADGKTVNGYTGKQIRDWVMTKNGFDSTSIKRVNAFMKAMSTFMKQAGVTYKFIGLQDVENAKLLYQYAPDGSIKSIILSAMVKNGDYPVNFDLTSICKKRVAMSKLIDKLSKRGDLDNGVVSLTQDNIFAINRRLKNEGFETACLGCFVESKRYNVKLWAETFCKKYNKAVTKINPNATYFGYGKENFSADDITLRKAVALDKAAKEFNRTAITERLENALKKYRDKAANGEEFLPKGLSKAAKDRLVKSDILTDEQKSYFLDKDTSAYTIEDIEVLLRSGVLSGAALSNKQSITEMVKSGEEYQHLLRPSDLLTADGMAKLRQLPNFYGVLYGHYGSGTPKVIQGFTPYNSEIALLNEEKGNKSLAEYLYGIAGVRMQSFSDFQIQNIYDYLQMVGDLAARKLPAHAYTKEISFAKLLGMTGIKTNLSVMFDVDPSLPDIEIIRDADGKPKKNDDGSIKKTSPHAGLTKYNPLVHKGEYAKIVWEDEYGKWVYNIGDYATQQAFSKAFPNEEKRFLQSIGFADAVKLQTSKGYTKNCGIIGVAYSDIGILAMLDDKRIRYIIPYHSSSLPETIKVATHIELATDYTSKQNNTKIVSVTDANGNTVKWSIKEASKRLGSGKAALDELNNHIKNDGWKVETKKSQGGHGSYQLYEDLQQTNDPKQTALNYFDWCAKNDTLPIFFEFSGHENYYKLLYDFNVYDCVTEEYAPQTAVTNTYPMQNKSGNVVAKDVTKGGFDEAYLQSTIDAQMEFMNRYMEGLDESLEAIADDLENGKINEGSSRIDVKSLKLSDREATELAKNASTNYDSVIANEGAKYSDRVTDKETLDFLNSQKTIKTYKSMQLVDGKLYPPMAAVVGGKYEAPSVLGQWEQAVEHPELIKTDKSGKAKFNLNKGKGQGTVSAAYNPYMHSSNLVLNDQFSAAYKRNLVTVECEIPVSELTSGYKAQYAKNSVGEMSWHTGPVAAQLKDNARMVYLTRWLKPVRIVPDAEVAKLYADLLIKDGISVPNNVVTPSLLSELEKIGVKIDYTVTYDEAGNVIPLSERFNESNEDIRYSDRETYSSQVDAVRNNTHDRFNHVYMGTTPTGIAKVLELPKLPMLITPNHVYSMAVSKTIAKSENRFNKRNSYHNLGWDVIKKLPEMIDKPVMIIKSNTDSDNATFVVVCAETNQNGVPIFAVISPNGKGNYYNLEVPNNFMLSSYGKDGFRNYIATAKTENRILYVSEKNSQKLKNTKGVQFSNNILASDYSENLSQFKDIVKKKFSGTMFENNTALYSDRDNVGYHAGDLGKAEYLKQQSSSRGTGHFGTGTYFVGEEAKVTKDSYYGKRPQHAVDFSNYNLYKVRNDRQGYRLHDALRVIDGGINADWILPASNMEYSVIDSTEYYKIAKEISPERYYEDSVKLKALKQVSEKYGLEVPSKETYVKEDGFYEPNDEFFESGYVGFVKEKIDEQIKAVNKKYAKFRDAYNDLEYSFHFDKGAINKALRKVASYQEETDRNSKSDSYATVFMKAVGYEGVDVRGTGLDNTAYGSVIYDVREDSVLYSDRDDTSLDNRTVLANAMETAAQNDIEKKKIASYKKNIKSLNEEEKKLGELRAKIKELSFAKGPRDADQIRKLQDEATKTANRINTYDKRLLELEASKPLKDVLQRERANAKKAAEKKGKEALDAYREKAAKTQREIMDRAKEARKKGIESRAKTEMRAKIKKVVGELNNYLLHGTKDKHIMIGLQKAVAEALDAVNMDTLNADARVAKYDALIAKATDPDVIASLTATRDRIAEQGDKMSDKLNKLKAAYDEIKNSNDPLIANSYDEVIANSIEAVKNEVGDTPLRNMSLSQLESVYDLYKMVLKTIRDSNKAFKAKKSTEISTLASFAMKELDALAKKSKLVSKAKDLIEKFGWNNLKPVQAFKAIGSDTFAELFANVRAGEDVWAKDIAEAKVFYQQTAKDYGIDKWDMAKTYEFTSTSGKTFKLNLEQIMSLYAYSKRDQAREHIRKGGIVIDERTEIKKGLRTFTVEDATSYNISDQTLSDIISKLSDEQKRYADAMQNYLSFVMGEKGNEVSLEMYGVKLFKERFYWPLKSAPQYMAKAKEQQQGEVKIKNSGFTKDTTPKASNPIVLSEFTDVWTSHVDEMSRYHAFTLPLEDFYRVYNYRTSTSENMPTESIEMYIQNVNGKGATQYIDQLLRDLNGGTRVDSTVGILNKGLSLFKKGAVMGSASVIIQQPSAIARALAYIDLKYFIGPKVKSDTKVWEECKKYAPVAVIKEMGGYDTHVGQSTKDYITGEKGNLLNKFDDLLGKGPALADQVTWCAIWQASKRKAKAESNLSGEALLKKAGEIFTEAIVNTQVYDSVLTRSAMMRSKDGLMKMTTAFMAEPTTSINMIADARLNWQNGNKKAAVAKVNSVVTSVILNSALVALVYAARDDDDDETYWEKYLSSLISKTMEGVNPLTYIPFIKDIYSVVQGYTVKRTDLSVYSDLIKEIQNFKKAIENDEDILNASIDLANQAMALVGIPTKNITREVRAFINTYGVAVNGEKGTKAGTWYAVWEGITEGSVIAKKIMGEKPSNKQQLYTAATEGDTEHEARVRGRYDDESKANSAFAQAVVDSYTAGNITKQQAIDLLVRKGGMEQEAAEKKMYNVEFKAEHGFTYSERIEAYADGRLSRQELINILVDGGKTQEEAETQVTVYDWQNEGFDIDSSSTSVIYDYYDYCEPAGIDKQTYYDAYLFYKDSGEEGVAYSKTIECIPYIDSLNLTADQKTQLALCWWSEKTVNKYKTW